MPLNCGLAPADSVPTVYFNGVAAPLAMYSGGQINALVPNGVPDVADVVVQSGGALTYPYPLGVVLAAPEIFTAPDGSTQAVAVILDITLNSPANPAAKGAYVAFWVTGQGQVSSATCDARPALSVSVTVAGENAAVSFAGIDPGVLQVNVQLPPDAPSGDAVPLVLTIGSVSSRKAATVAIQ
jgi:uncharacterized protein (TIGR03437 family)